MNIISSVYEKIANIKETVKELLGIKQFDAAVTHAGVFHADDVFSAALLRLFNPSIKIIRTLEVPEKYDGLIFDIGHGNFDHHQLDSRVRDNGVPYASFGLLWEALGWLIVGKKEATKFDEQFVQGIDLTDNTGAKNELSRVISEFNPMPGNCKDEERQLLSDKAFEEAVSLATVILRIKIERSIINSAQTEMVREQIKNDDEEILVLDEFMYWKDAVENTNIKYVIYPSDRGGVSIQATPISSETNELKLPFPLAWRGKPAEYLQKATGVGTVKFCHQNGFLAATDNVQDSIKLATISLMQG